METIEHALYVLSTLFFYPVIAGLLMLLLLLFFELGAFTKESWIRLRHPDVSAVVFNNKLIKIPLVMSAGMLELELQRLLEESEQAGKKRLDRARYAVKMGPTLGLIGTLTPMARALSGLASGDLTSLSSQMITAFSTTVIGLVVGGLAFSIVHVRTRWKEKDAYRLAALAEQKLLDRKEGGSREVFEK